MYFEAKKPEHAAAPTGAMRMYINTCFITASQDYTSTPKYTVIDNFGCMIDSKVQLQSKFITGTSKTSQKFGMTALIFKDKVSTSSVSQQIYMHSTRNMVSSHSWMVDVHPRMKVLDADTFTLEDPSMAAHKDCLQHWNMTIKTNM
ncbi:hypothetical protein KUCAC02_015160 [Chaenocephalus aceratus]|uniref:Uncharacterized protein n=1 Tax=Chaenocephalus aceratus TaxID=36190 RepID=A0ACB9XXK4_CHAAC|nr:hypothetical protein KUCAC02_015160 [Chaenocephalus aceratus]